MIYKCSKINKFNHVFFQLKLWRLGGKVMTAFPSQYRVLVPFQYCVSFERILVDPALGGTTPTEQDKVQFVLLHLVLESTVESRPDHNEEVKYNSSHIGELYCY